MCRARERFLSAGEIAGVRVNAHVCTAIVDRQPAGFDRGERVCDARQNLVIHLHALGRVHCRVHRFGNHHRYRLADKAGAIRRQWRVRHDGMRCAVAVFEQDVWRA